MSAPQIGSDYRFFLSAITQRNNLRRIYVMLNPEILEYSKETNIDDEGCLSSPKLKLIIKIEYFVKLKGQIVF